MVHCTLLKLVFIKGIHKEQNHFCLHQLDKRRPLTCKMHMKTTFHSNKPKWVERKIAGRGVTVKQSSISFYRSFLFWPLFPIPSAWQHENTSKSKNGPQKMWMSPRLSPSLEPALPPTELQQRLRCPAATTATLPCPLPQSYTAPASGCKAAPLPLRRTPLLASAAGEAVELAAPRSHSWGWVAEQRLPLGSLFLLFPPALILPLLRSLHGGGSVPGSPSPGGRSGSPAAAAPHRPVRMGCVCTYIQICMIHTCTRVHRTDLSRYTVPFQRCSTGRAILARWCPAGRSVPLLEARTRGGGRGGGSTNGL